MSKHHLLCLENRGHGILCRASIIGGHVPFAEGCHVRRVSAEMFEGAWPCYRPAWPCRESKVGKRIETSPKSVLQIGRDCNAIVVQMSLM